MKSLRYVIDPSTHCPPGWTMESYSTALRAALAPLGIWLVIHTTAQDGPTGLQGSYDEEMQARVASALDGLRAQRSTSAVVGMWRR